MLTSEETLSARIFIEFIALIVRNRIYNLLKERTFSGSIPDLITCLPWKPCENWKRQALFNRGDVKNTYRDMKNLPCSMYGYAEAFADMKASIWLSGYIYAFGVFRVFPR